LDIKNTNRKPKNYWNYQHSLEAALMCETRSEFSKKYSQAYDVARKNEWLEDFCKHMRIIRPSNDYWNYEHCLEVAKLCQIRSEFHRRFHTAFIISKNNGWLDDMYKHMKESNRNNKIWSIYSYVFYFNNIKYAYVGVTDNLKRRKYEHLNKNSSNSSVFEFICKNNINKNDIIYNVEFINIDSENIASNLEIKYENKYKEDGYILLNKIKAGNLGGNGKKWTIEKCIELINSCKTVNEFIKKYYGAYSYIRKHKLQELLFKNLKYNKMPNNYWTYEMCIEKVYLCKSYSEFVKQYSGAYSSSVRNNWIDEFSKILNKKNIKPKNYWQYDNCKNAANNCINKEEFYNKYPGAFSASNKNNWLNEFF